MTFPVVYGGLLLGTGAPDAADSTAVGLSDELQKQSSDKSETSERTTTTPPEGTSSISISKNPNPKIRGLRNYSKGRRNSLPARSVHLAHSIPTPPQEGEGGGPPYGMDFVAMFPLAFPGVLGRMPFLNGLNDVEEVREGGVVSSFPFVVPLPPGLVPSSNDEPSAPFNIGGGGPPVPVDGGASSSPRGGPQANVETKNSSSAGSKRIFSQEPIPGPPAPNFPFIFPDVLHVEPGYPSGVVGVLPSSVVGAAGVLVPAQLPSTIPTPIASIPTTSKEGGAGTRRDSSTPGGPAVVSPCPAVVAPVPKPVEDFEIVFVGPLGGGASNAPGGTTNRGGKRDGKRAEGTSTSRGPSGPDSYSDLWPSSKEVDLRRGATSSKEVDNHGRGTPTVGGSWAGAGAGFAYIAYPLFPKGFGLDFSYR